MGQASVTNGGRCDLFFALITLFFLSPPPTSPLCSSYILSHDSIECHTLQNYLLNTNIIYMPYSMSQEKRRKIDSDINNDTVN